MSEGEELGSPPMGFLEEFSVSPTLAMNEKCSELERSGRTVYRLAFGESPFPVPDSLVSRLQEFAKEKSYLSVAGLWELREAIAHHTTHRLGIPVTPDQVFVGPGSKALLFLAQMVEQRCSVLLPAPSWVSYAPQALIAGNEVHTIPTQLSQGWKITPEGLLKACHSLKEGKKYLILNSPANPTGAVYTKEELTELSEICRNKGIIVFSDEIYSELCFQADFCSPTQILPEQTIMSSGLSKAYGAGGWRLGYFVIPTELSGFGRKLLTYMSESYSSVTSPVQYAASAAFEERDEIKQYLREVRTILRGVAVLSAQLLREAGLEVCSSEGGFYLFPSFEKFRHSLRERGIVSSLDLANDLLEKQSVATLPGAAFNMDSQSLTLRLAYIDFEGEKALSEWTNDLSPEENVRRCCRKTVEGIQRIAEYCSQLSRSC